MQIQNNLLFRMILFLSGLISTIVVIGGPGDTPYLLFTIPLTYSILIFSLSSMTRPMFHYLGLLALNVCMVFRYVISPFLNGIYGVYVTTSIVPSDESFQIAVLLMLFEMIVIFLLVTLFSKRFYSKNFDKKIVPTFNIMGYIYILVCIFLVLISPSLINEFNFIFTTETIEQSTTDNGGASIVNLFIQLGSFVLTITILNMLYKFYIRNPKFKYMLLSLLTVLFTSSFMVGTSRFSIIIPLISGLFIIFLLYKKYRLVLATIATIIVLSFVSVSTFVIEQTIQSVNTATNTINDTIQQYFSGVSNVAVAVETSTFLPSFDFQMILSDIINNVVVLNHIFNSDYNTITAFNSVFYSGGPATDQILPLLGQGYIYFGFIFSPILTIITVMFIFYLDRKMKNSADLPVKLILAFVTLKFGLFMMSNMTILMSFFINQFMLLLVIFGVNIFLERMVLGKYEYR